MAKNGGANLGSYDYLECRALAHAFFPKRKVVYENVSNSRQRRRHRELVEILECYRGCGVIRLDHFSITSLEFLYRKYDYKNSPGYLLLGQGRIRRDDWNAVRLRDAVKKASVISVEDL